MADEFLDHDLDTPTEADLDLAYGSKYLSASDVGDKKIRTRIQKVRKETLKGNDGRERLKFVLFYDTLDKPMVLNATNKDELVTVLGRVPANWIGATVGVHVVPVSFAGKLTKGVRIRVLNKPAGSASQPKPQPKPQPAAEESWPKQKGDPGFDGSDWPGDTGAEFEAA
jgi:hypothetical protein